MRLSILWRIMEIEEGVIRRGRRPRRITPSENFLTHADLVSLYVKSN